MSEHAGVLEAAWRLGQAFDRCGVHYLVGGSVASSLQGLPRSTQDIDVVADLPAGKVDALVRALGDDFLVDDLSLKEAMQLHRSWNIFFAPTALKIDIFSLGPSDYDVEALTRRKQVEVAPGRSIFVSSPEDTVLRKLMWFQAGGEQNSQQLRDVIDVMRVQGPAMDGAYLDRWAAKLGVAALLQRARAATAI